LRRSWTTNLSVDERSEDLRMKSECEYHAWGDDRQGRLSVNPYVLLAVMAAEVEALKGLLTTANQDCANLMEANEDLARSLRAAEADLRVAEASLAGRVE
jgi:hypothetical protein